LPAELRADADVFSAAKSKILPLIERDDLKNWAITLPVEFRFDPEVISMMQAKREVRANAGVLAAYYMLEEPKIVVKDFATLPAELQGHKTVLASYYKRADPREVAEHFMTLPLDHRADQELALLAVAKDGMLLQFTSEVLRGTEKVVLTAVRNNAAALEFAKPPLNVQDPRLTQAAGLRTFHDVELTVGCAGGETSLA